MKTLALVFCTLFIPLMGVAQEEVPHRISTNYVGKLATEADKLLGKADEAFDNEDYDTAFKYYQKVPKLAIQMLILVLEDAMPMVWAQYLMLKMHYIGTRKLLMQVQLQGNTILAFFILKVGTVKNPIRKRVQSGSLKLQMDVEPWAMFYIGNCYKRGDGVEKNIDEAIRWYKKAAEYGDEDAPLLLKELGAEMPENTE